MPDLLDIRFRFICRSTHKNKLGKYTIVLRIIFRRELRDVFTGLYCKKYNWSVATEKLSLKDKQASVINRNIDVIPRKANDAFDSLRFSREIFSIDELVDKIKGEENRPTLLIDFLEEGREGMLKG